MSLGDSLSLLSLTHSFENDGGFALHVSIIIKGKTITHHNEALSLYLQGSYRKWYLTFHGPTLGLTEDRE